MWSFISRANGQKMDLQIRVQSADIILVIATLVTWLSYWQRHKIGERHVAGARWGLIVSRSRKLNAH